MNYDIAVIGAGIVGAACASSLSSAGLRVVVIDANGIATGTTAAGMGHIVLMDDSDAQFALTQYSQKLWNRLSIEMPSSSEFEQCGTMWVAADDEEMTEVRRKHDFYAGRGIATQILDEQALRKAEPNLREGLAGGLLVKTDSVVYQLTACRYLIAKACENGADVSFGLPVSEIIDGGARLANGEIVSAGA